MLVCEKINQEYSFLKNKFGGWVGEWHQDVVVIFGTCFKIWGGGGRGTKWVGKEG